MGKLDPKRRAMREDQKEERRQAILAAAWQLYESATYETITMGAVAQALGLAKGTIFLYFKTKEALFLALIEQQLTTWFAEVDARLTDLDAACTSQQVTEVLCKGLEDHPGLTRLLAILHTILEQNIDFEAALQFKYLLLQHFERTGALLEQRLPFLAPGEGAHLLLQCHALVIGLWHLSDLAPVVQQVLLRHAELRMFKVHFAAEFSATVQALLDGLERRAQAAHRVSPQEETL